MNKKIEIQIKELLANNKLTFVDRLASKMFFSHMSTLEDRLKSQEPLDNDEHDYRVVLNEINEDVLSAAKEIAKITFSTYDQEPTMMEIVLIATHLQAQRYKEKEVK
ncbi:MAG: PRD domain-containing protein [Erysipelotrichaceae bacterium]